mmetsp:Transcript_58988/g.125066  ORF Transcript_58988/g.125066 Transcript_58988/m.125066 type:complete len:330 (+) Transcript_58988:177-1166(+)
MFTSYGATSNDSTNRPNLAAEGATKDKDETAPLSTSSLEKGKTTTTTSRRWTPGYVAPFVCLFLPWLLCTLNWLSLGFALRYRHPELSWLVVHMGLVAIGVEGYFMLVAWRKRSKRDLTWLSFLLATSGIAWCVGLYFGLATYSMHMRPLYEIQSLETYVNVDPRYARGQQYMDGGRFIFTKSSFPNPGKSSSVQDDSSEVYCAAPVETRDEERLASYDFWVIGKDCCPPAADSFTCAGTSTSAHAATRVLDETDLSKYRSAVQAAASKYGLSTVTPLLLTWQEDPISLVNEQKDIAIHNFTFGALLYFIFQLFGVAVTSSGIMPCTGR